MRMKFFAIVGLAVPLAACVGGISGGGRDDGATTGSPSPSSPGRDGAGGAGGKNSGGSGPSSGSGGMPSALAARDYGPTDVRRLSREELGQTIQDLLGVDVRDVMDRMPVDPVSTPFDNNARDQVPSAALLEGTKAIATTATQRVLANAAAKERLLGCKPTAAGDEACLRKMVTRFGRSAFRRPLTTEEIDRYVSVAKAVAVEAATFDAAIEVVLRAMLQDVNFLYRIELGTPVDRESGLVALTPFETATRLSYLWWGSTPSEALLDLAASGGLDTSADVRAAAEGMLRDPRALAQWQRAHAMWLDYEAIEAADPLAKSMRAESDSLLGRVWSRERPWTYLFTAQETFVDAALATHYGLAAPNGGKGWVPYAAPTRAGLLSHGSVLSNGQKFGRTSIVQRGQYVLTRLACAEVPPPPPALEVNVDDPPKPDVCKVKAVDEHAMRPACAGCHRTLDGAGKGLEGYDLLGRARTKDESNCDVDPRGELVIGGESIGTFAGPGDLASKLLESERLDSCFVEQVFQFAAGRPPLEADTAAIDNLVARFRLMKYDLVGLLLAYVEQPAFLHRVLVN